MHYRPLSRGIALGVALLATAPAQHLGAQSLPTAEALAARHDSLVGGRAALDAHQSMRLMGRFTFAAAGIDAPLEILKVRPNKYLFRTSLGPMGEVLQGFDGANAWASQPGQPAMLIVGPQAEQIATQADFFGDLHDLTRFTSLETVGEETFEGRRSWKVKLTRPSGDIVYEYFDVETGLSAGGATTLDGPMGRTENISVFSDYRDFDGYRTATRVVQRQAQVEFVISIVAIEFDRVEESAVALPEALRALVLTGELAEHFKGISLTPGQVRQVNEIQARQHAAMDSLRKAATDPQDPALRAALAKLMADEHAAFKALLTPGQQQQFEANMMSHHQAEARRP